MKGKREKHAKTKTKPIQKNNGRKVKELSENILDEEERRAEISGDEYVMDNEMEKDETAEDKKLRIAKKLIGDMKQSLKKKKGDDFFLDEEDEKKEDDLVESLKNEYLRGKNKLYANETTTFRNMKVSEPVSYKGHTLCITAIEMTDKNIYSCSKDKSIIEWDRQTGKKNFITLGKNEHDHSAAILSMSYHPIHQMLATAGEDDMVKLWDIRNNSLIETLKGHRGSVNGVKFGLNSPNLCSVSSDRTFKQWDCSQRGLIETFYGHNFEALDIDCFNQNDFISSGADQQAIIWKTEKETQIIFQGHQYPIDRVRTINNERFITGSQDGSIYLWSDKKKKAIQKHRNVHEGWICALDCIKQTNIFASGGSEKVVKIWAIDPDNKNLTLLQELQTPGIVTDLKINNTCIAATACDEHRLGRWVKGRCRNQIEVFSFISE